MSQFLATLCLLSVLASPARVDVLDRFTLDTLACVATRIVVARIQFQQPSNLYDGLLNRGSPSEHVLIPVGLIVERNIFPGTFLSAPDTLLSFCVGTPRADIVQGEPFSLTFDGKRCLLFLKTWPISGDTDRAGRPYYRPIAKPAIFPISEKNLVADVPTQDAHFWNNGDTLSLDTCIARIHRSRATMYGREEEQRAKDKAAMLDPRGGWKLDGTNVPDRNAAGRATTAPAKVPEGR